MSGQTCTAPSQCIATPGFPDAPVSHVCLPGFIASPVFTETFDGGFGVFSEDPVPVGANDLTVSTAGDTPSAGTGPETTAGCNGGNNDGEFIILEGSFTLSGEVHCMSANIPIPPLDANNTSYTMSFWYHMFGDNIGELEIFINGGSAFSVTGQQQTQNCQPWLQGSIDLTAVAGTSPTVQICMSEGNGAISTFESDISIDHIQVFGCGSAPMCDIAITGVNSTPETCDMGNDGSITITATSSNPPISYAISGPVNTSNGTGVFNGLPPGSYDITVTDAFGGTCEATDTEMVIAGMSLCPTVSRTDPTIFDPCSCGDPLNYVDGMGDVSYFHDFVLVTSAPGETWEFTAVAGAFHDDGTTPVTPGTVLPETPPGSGMYRLDLFHAPGVGFTCTVDRTAGGPPFPLMTGGTCSACAQVPTLGQWGLIILGLLILTFGVVVLRSREMAIAGYSSVETSKFSRLPFDKALFGKALIAVMLGLAATFAVAVTAFGYEMTAADVPGSLVAGPMLAYLLHLFANKKK